MKLNFGWSDDGKYHQYCLKCHKESVKRIQKNNKTYYFCKSCKKTSERSIVLDPAINWWIASDGEYWHESAGVFLRDSQRRFLFFERSIYPFALTVPSGHVDKGETPIHAAKRELKEEVGVKVGELTLVASENIVGDKCRRGSDAHLWHAFLAKVDNPPRIVVAEEGSRPLWLTLKESKDKKLTYPVDYIINNFYNDLLG